MTIRRLLLLTLLLIPALVLKGRAQTVEVIDELSWITDDANDVWPQHTLRYGYGTDWSSKPDTAGGKGEFIIPGFSPDGFDALFSGVEDYFGDKSNYAYSDVRGVPDSVASGQASKFSLTWTIALHPGLGRPIIETQGNLRRGIDSVRIRSTASGSGFDHTFYGKGRETVTMNRSDIRQLEMTVWFDYGLLTSGVPQGTPVVADAHAVPNPLRSGERFSVVGVNDPEARYTVRDIMGREIERSVGHPPVLIESGNYILTVVEANGTMHRARLIVQ